MSFQGLATGGAFRILAGTFCRFAIAGPNPQIVTMTFLERYLPALALALILMISSVGSAFAMGPQRAEDGSIVICNGSGLVTITIGDGETEHDYVMLCPECLPATDGVTAPVLVVPTLAGELVQVVYAYHLPDLFDAAIFAHGQPRAPPFV